MGGGGRARESPSFSRPHAVTPKQVAQENVTRGFRTKHYHLFGSTIALPLSTKQTLMLWFWAIIHSLAPIVFVPSPSSKKKMSQQGLQLWKCGYKLFQPGLAGAAFRSQVISWNPCEHLRKSWRVLASWYWYKDSPTDC